MSTWTAENKTLAGAEALLMESGSYLLLESDFHIILEQSNPGSVTWTGASKDVGSWTGLSKVGIDDVLGSEVSDIIITESSDNIGLDQSDSTGVTWLGLSKS